MSDSERENRGQKVANGTKITKITKFLNHVFKTSKKTLSYSRTYCKIYKIENIGKIGQSASSILAKRVIYYGSTRSTLSTPPHSKWPPHFSRWILNFWKKWNYHFWGFLSQNRQKSLFSSFLTHLVNLHGHFDCKVKSPDPKSPKMSKMDLF